MKPDLARYQTLVFDCDGVLLDSNRVKTQAFYQAALPYGVAPAEALVDYHVRHGGVSRYRKFTHFLQEIVPQHACGMRGPELDELLALYASAVLQGLHECTVATGLDELRKHTAPANWLIVSGGDQTELRKVFAARGLDKLFDGGIFGSPDSKEEILQRELEQGNIRQSALFLGDSIYDHTAASSCGLDFVFVSNWSEVNNWQQWCDGLGLARVPELAALLPV